MTAYSASVGNEFEDGFGENQDSCNQTPQLLLNPCVVCEDMLHSRTASRNMTSYPSATDNSITRNNSPRHPM